MNYDNLGKQTEKKYEKSVGAMWLKTSENTGKKFVSIVVELDGVKHNFTAFKNELKQEGENTPDYRIFPSVKKPVGGESL